MICRKSWDKILTISANIDCWLSSFLSNMANLPFQRDTHLGQDDEDYHPPGYATDYPSKPYTYERYSIDYQGRPDSLDYPPPPPRPPPRHPDSRVFETSDRSGTKTEEVEKSKKKPTTTFSEIFKQTPEKIRERKEARYQSIKKASFADIIKSPSTTTEVSKAPAEENIKTVHLQLILSGNYCCTLR